MKKIGCMILLCGVLCLNACNTAPEVVLDVDYEMDEQGENTIQIEAQREKDLAEFEEFFFNSGDSETESPEEQKYDLESQIIEKATVEFADGYDKDSEVINGIITAPDVYSYIMENQEELMLLETEELYQTILAAFQDEGYPVRTAEIELPVTYENGKLIVDTNSYKYKDAVSGGMYSALTDIYAKVIEILQEELQ